MSQSCKRCRAEFVVDEVELDLLKRVSPIVHSKVYLIPPPELCPACREQDRMAWRNERTLFSRTCDRTGAKLISALPPNTKFPVYQNAEWWKSESDYILDTPIDLSRSIFSQIAELQQHAPRCHTFNYAEDRMQNSLYTNCAGDLKDCYLIFASGRDERCLYSTYINDSFDSVDNFFVFRANNCYECVDVQSCNSLFFSRECTECFDAFFLADCRGCSDCIGCVGLRQKRFHIFNQPYTQDEYLKKRSELGLEIGKPLSRAKVESVRTKFAQLLPTLPRRYIHGEQNEGSTGDYLWNTKNCVHCFDTYKSQDCRYCTWFSDGVDSMDVYAWGECELCYQVSSGGDTLYKCAFTAMSYNCKECYYTDLCPNSKNCFACVGLKGRQYCILNREFSEDEYWETIPKVIERMISDGEWGKLLPVSISPFGYNHSVAQEYYPLKKEEALALGYLWSDYESPIPTAKRTITVKELPDTIAQVGDDILDTAIVCEVNGKPFRITRPELEFYRKHGLPLPSLHPDERHLRRLRGRNPRKLWKRNCKSCQTEFQTTYSPDRPEVVYCESCYLDAMY